MDKLWTIGMANLPHSHASEVELHAVSMLTKDPTLVMAFTEEQVANLAHISLDQIRYWDRTNFFRPSFGAENRRTKYSRIYSFKDVVGLRTLGLLINEHNVPTKYLRDVRNRLKKPQEVWADTTLYLLGKKVYFERPELTSFEEPVSGQLTLKSFPLRPVINEVKRSAEKLRERPKESIGQFKHRRHISTNSEIIEGTRVPVSTVAEYLEDGSPDAEILRNFPALAQEDIDAVREWMNRGAA